MATKTFKIGLSNTDKQNMAQDVYERLLALTFPEYDSAESYEVGDFVVYNDQLYKCIGSTTGAWDSTKWQLATLNDLVSDIEYAVQFVNDKANVDGNYPTMTVGVADQLSPYDDESGDDQDEPFNFQATGTANGTQPDFATGSIALMKEKQGNTVVVNQLSQGSLYRNISGLGITISVSGNNLVLNGSPTQDIDTNLTSNVFPFSNSHKYLLFASQNLISGIKLGVNYNYGTNGNFYLIENTTDKHICMFIPSGLTIPTDYTIKINIVDLTQWFNGDIPQDLLDNPSNFFRYYQGSLAYNTGELVNADGRYIKCIGMNQWDEEWEEGNINSSNGQNVSSSTQIRSKNYIRVLPNTQYYLACNDINYGGIRFFCYDIDKNFISLINYKANGDIFTTPANCAYIRFNDYSGTTYNNDISINLYYEDEARCLTYEPYQVLTNNDTGTEELLFLDKKTPDGTWYKNTGKSKFSDLTFTKGTNNRFVSTSIVDTTKKYADSELPNAICGRFEKETPTNVAGNTKSNIFSINNAGALVVFVDATYYSNHTVEQFLSDYGNCEIEYELADASKTTEQGTPYSENLVIDDFGTMDFQGTNGVPQGNLIFYPVDYKAFIDTLYNYTEGTPSELVKQSDLSADKTELQGVDTQLKENIGGMLRHQLVANVVAGGGTIDLNNTKYVDLGDATWSYSSGLFYTSSFASDIQNVTNGNVAGNLLCSIYKTAKYDNVGDSDNSISTYYKGIYLKNSAYTDATAFKNAMKGILLAYEKAE